MKRFLSAAGLALLSALTLTGCGVGTKSASLTSLYIATTLLAVLTLIAYVAFVRRKDPWYLLLFSAVPVVNIGYWWLSAAQTLDIALWANRLSYLGSVLLPPAMLMIILNAANMHYPRWVPWTLLGISGGVFAVAATPGICGIYYESVSLLTVNNSTVLDKVYGPWHPLYLLFLLGYFAAMIAVILHATVKKTVPTTVHAILLTTAVFVNIGVWLVGQFSRLDFEFLSISYIISELFLLGLQLLIQDGDKLFSSLNGTSAESVTPTEPVAENAPDPLAEALATFTAGLTTLTPTEHTVYTYYTEGKPTKEVLELMHITENTLKYHNRNLYSKLGVSSRKQLRELAQRLSVEPQ